jgi:integrase
LLSPYRLASEAETAQALAARADTITARVDQLNAEANPGTLLRHGWSVYLKSPKRPRTGLATLGQYELQFEKFARWVEAENKGVRRFNEITSEHATRFVAWMEKGRAAGTVNKYLNLLDLVWRTLSRDAANRITSNPWATDEITREKISKATRGRRELSPVEIKSVIDIASGEMRTLLAIGIFTGLRFGDAVRLNWAEVDFRRGIILTIPHKTARSSGEPVAIPIAPALRRELVALGLRSSGPILPGLAAEYERDRNIPGRKVSQLFEAAGLSRKETIPGRRLPVVRVGFHSLRHSFITNAALLGWPEEVVRRIVGHTSRAVTDRYIHIGVAAVKSLPAMPDPLALPAATELRRDPLPDWAREILEKSTVKTWRRDRAALLEG